jgi:hypothetical protein
MFPTYLAGFKLFSFKNLFSILEILALDKLELNLF